MTRASLCNVKACARFCGGFCVPMKLIEKLRMIQHAGRIIDLAVNRVETATNNRFGNFSRGTGSTG